MYTNIRASDFPKAQTWLPISGPGKGHNAIPFCNRTHGNVRKKENTRELRIERKRYVQFLLGIYFLPVQHYKESLLRLSISNKKAETGMMKKKTSFSGEKKLKYLKQAQVRRGEILRKEEKERLLQKPDLFLYLKYRLEKRKTKLTKVFSMMKKWSPRKCWGGSILNVKRRQASIVKIKMMDCQNRKY